MKEKDIVDFTKMKKIEHEHYDEYIDDNGNEVGCKICYTHDKAYEKFNELTKNSKVKHLCPKCGKRLVRDCYSHTDDNGMVVVSEVNYSKPEGNIGYYELYYCENPECEDFYGQSYYALIPERVCYNGNHGIFYTGGDDYFMDKDMEELAKMVFEAVKPSIDQYVERKLNPVNVIDKNLSEWNLHLWTSRDVSSILAKWFYEHGLKK